MSLYVANENLIRVGPAQETVDKSYVNDAVVTVDVAIDVDDSTANQITGATDATPVVITTAAAHGLASGDRVVVTRVGGNGGANGAWQVTVLSSTTFSLNDSVGSGTYTGGGRVYDLLAAAYGAIEAEHLGGELGEYAATLSALAPLQAGTDYRLVCRMTRDGTLVATWEIVETAQVRG